jgi:uncharacterized protein YuzB (UPF0349 family)
MNKSFFCIVLIATTVVGNPGHDSHHRDPYHHHNHHHPHQPHKEREKTEVIINVNDGKESKDSSKLQFVPMAFNSLGVVGGIALAVLGKEHNSDKAFWAGLARAGICSISGFTGAKVVSPATNSTMSFVNMLTAAGAAGISIFTFINGEVVEGAVAAAYTAIHIIDVFYRFRTDESKK